MKPSRQLGFRRTGVAVTGVGVLSPIGVGRADFVDNLRSGSSGISPITAFDVTQHRCKVGGEVRDFSPEHYFGKKELRRLDRASQLLLVAAREAVAASRVDLASLDPARCGVVVGTTLGGMISGQRYHRLLKLEGKRQPSLLIDFPHHAPADRLCQEFDLRGASLTVSPACASGGQAIGVAYDLIRAGEADVVLAGGVDTMSELTHAGFGALRLLIAEGESIRPFDRNRTGFALGEGAAVLLMEAMESADRRGAAIAAEVCGYGQSTDAHHMTAPHPEGRGAAMAMSGALATAGISANDVQYVNAHGTGSIQNDIAESRAIKQVFCPRGSHIPVSSTKSMIGHTLGAAGTIEAVATILAMQQGFIPPTINFQTPDPECDLDCVANNSRPASIRVAMSNSFGFGGANCSIVFVRGTDYVPVNAR